MRFHSPVRAVVTGAGSGLGRAFCRALTQRGARVVAADIDLSSAEATATLISGEIHPTHCDVAQLADVEALARTCDERLGGVDLVINNAGVAVGGAVGEVAIADWQWAIGVNLWGVIHGCHVFVPRLRRQRSGHVLNVASAAGLLSPPLIGPYNVSKAGVIALSETLRGEAAPDGVGVTVLCPTFFKTNIARAARGSLDAVRDTVEKMMARSTLQADDVARLALEGVEADVLYVAPHSDGRWMWRVKRLVPGGFHAIVPRLLDRLSGRL